MMFNNKDFIFYRRASYSQEGCDYAIRFFEKRIDLQEVGTHGNRFDPHEKKCSEMVLKRKEYTFLEDMLQGCIREYVKKYPSVQLMERWDLAPRFKIQRYNPGEGYFVEHCENSGAEGDIKRMLAWMVYLNDVTDGGYTKFPKQNRKFQPRRGDVLMWPAYFTHPHCGVTSKTQTKYIATGWCSFKE